MRTSIVMMNPLELWTIVVFCPWGHIQRDYFTFARYFDEEIFSEGRRDYLPFQFSMISVCFFSIIIISLT